VLRTCIVIFGQAENESIAGLVFEADFRGGGGVFFLCFLFMKVVLIGWLVDDRWFMVRKFHGKVWRGNSSGENN
jgi:hypothetical protein